MRHCPISKGNIMMHLQYYCSSYPDIAITSDQLTPNLMPVNVLAQLDGVTGTTEVLAERADWIMEGQRAFSLGIRYATMKKLPKFNPTKKQYQKVSDTNASNSICWCHYRFRQNAHKCIKPCIFKLTKGIQSIHPNNTDDGFSSDHTGP